MLTYYAGCDITYNIHNLDSIFSTIKNCLSINGIVLICHDNESCPLSSKVLPSLVRVSSEIGLIMEEVNYETYVEASYVSDTVKMWKFVYYDQYKTFCKGCYS